MDLKKYVIFSWTKRYLEKHFSEEICSKYGNIIGFLFQNGYDLNCTNEEVEEQLSLFNFFNDVSDFEELKSTSKIESDYSIGKRILIEEIYDIVKKGAFVQTDTDNVAVIRTLASSNWKTILDLTNRIDSIFNSSDSEIVGAFKEITNLLDIRNRIDFLKEKESKEIKVLSWIKFKELIGIIYSVYIRLGKIKQDYHKFTIFENVNNELYGTGGYNPNTNEVICKYGGAVFECKRYYETSDINSLKYIAKDILKNGDYTDDKVEYLIKWTKGISKDNYKAKQIIVNCLLSGIFSLLSIKNNLNFIEDKKNSERADKIKKEFTAIVKYCGIEKEYVF